ncbi:sensor histidine kinase [Rubellimicrobium mesophilum]|uniref:sensor histidine kinase n=1 Tax=Rubellimicrobium mesophilum TaxID=1123067 RepID=UPI001B802510|nr:histidine kinase dimerization/phosphoacceptor domain -containing protein [Rubellimicrobium mesophilum]
MNQVDALPPDFSVGLANAVILATDAPSLLLRADLTVMVASRSFCRTFGIDPAQTVLRPLTSLGAGEWNIPQLIALLQATASGYAAVESYEMDFHREGQPVRHLLINARKLNYPSDESATLLLSCVDVTEARHREQQKEDLLREKAVLLRELNHRIANSLQIIASVLLQGARTVQSEEARLHINEAHHRLMSVAELQRQLALSHLERVVLADYLASLCRSIGASMIRDPSRLTIEVDVDDSVVTPEVSLSLGLIVTELVINALKHAFPDQRGGRIVVGFASTGEGWELTVRDDGVGLPEGPDQAKAGLGSNIVRALVMQLDATISMAAVNPGTLVSVTHDAADAANAQPTPAAV